MPLRKPLLHPLAKLDHQFVWHPFTQMQDWLKTEPIVISKAKGAVLKDVHGKSYLDANSSIWTNLHGHQRPELNRAITSQLRKIAHSSALGFANEPASLLARELVHAAQPAPPAHATNNGRLTKVFFSDDGSTANEVAIKLAYEYARRNGQPKPRFLSLSGAYHGDTVGAVSVGKIELFHRAYSGLLFKSDTVPAPYCYRCPANRARPERADARTYRKCNWECIQNLQKGFSKAKQSGNPYSAFVFEPLMQGAAGMIAQPQGWLSRAAQIARQSGALLVADEVMTGFGRTGVSSTTSVSHPRAKKTDLAPLFACQHENVDPDFLCLAKGLTGGYLPMAATLTTQRVFDAFLGEYSEFKTFFHGHSYTGNQLGSAAGLTSMRILHSLESRSNRARLQQDLKAGLESLWKHPTVGDIRQVGTIAGIELVRDWRSKEPFALERKAGIRVCEAMAKYGVLTRPVGNVLVLMPPYCTTSTQLEAMTRAMSRAIREVLQS